MTKITSANITPWTITLGALHRAGAPFWKSVSAGAFITVAALLLTLLGRAGGKVDFFNEALGPTLAGFFIALWGAQVWIPWRPSFLDKFEDWTLDSFLIGAGVLVGAAIVLIGVKICYPDSYGNESACKLLFATIATTILIHIPAGALAFLRDHSERIDARKFRFAIGIVCLIAIPTFLVFVT